MEIATFFIGIIVGTLGLFVTIMIMEFIKSRFVKQKPKENLILMLEKWNRYSKEMNDDWNQLYEYLNSELNKHE